MNNKIYKSRTLWLLVILFVTLHNTNAQVIAYHNHRPNSTTLQSKTLKDILNDFRGYYKVDILFSDQMINSLSVQDEKINLNNKIEDNLENILQPLGLKYKKTDGKTYLIVRNSKKQDVGTINGSGSSEGFAGGKAEESNLNFSIFQSTITGTVTNENGEPLPGVNVVLKGSTSGTVTDEAGKYTLSVPDGEGTLVFSFVGYSSEEILISNRTVVDISLLPDLQSLSEVVVIGYGTVKKRDLTGSVSSVKGDEIVQTPTHNAIEAIQGRVPGADITRSSGAAGAVSNITIRGNKSITSKDLMTERNSPLYVIDGYQGGNINDINPNDIQSVEVLKDASATAIYGALGANGVIIVTTKKGASGKTKLSYNGYYGVNQYTFPKSRTRDEYINLRREAYRASVTAAKPNGEWTSPADDDFIFSEVAGELDALKADKWVDWVDLVNRDGMQQSHSLSMTGGTDKTKVFASGGYFKEEGMLRNNDYTRFNGRFNLDQTINKWAKVGLLTQVTYSIQNNRRDPLGQAASISPLGTAYDENGLINIYPNALITSMISPLADERTDNVAKDNNIRTNIMTNGYLELTPLKGLSFRSNFGSNLTFNRRGIFNDATSFAQNTLKVSSASNEVDFVRFYNWDNILTYTKELNDHTITLTGITSYLQSDADEVYGSGNKQVLSSQLYYDLGATSADGRLLRSPYIGYKNMAYAGRFNYSFRGKYLLTLSGRYDGASRLAPGKKWDFFPSIALGWNVSDESFLKDVEQISNLKLRASYGVSGNYGIAVYGTQSGLVASTRMGFGDIPAPMYQFKTTIGNPDLGWEKSATTDIGLDLGLFRNRITTTVDLYHTTTSDILMLRTLPQSSGVGSVYQNIAETQNKGIEIAITSRNIDAKDFKWSTTLTFTRNKEEITKLIDGKDIINNERESLLLGRPINSFYTFQKEGVWQTNEAEEAAILKFNSKTGTAFKPGDIKLADLNGDSVIDATNDRTYIGSTVPKWVAGLQNNFSYKGIDLGIFIVARYGQTIDAQYLGRYNTSGTGNGPAVINYWTPENPTNDYPRPLKGSNLNNYAGYQTLNFVDGSYFKVRNVTLGYTLPKKITEKFFIERARVYATGTNLYIKAKSHLLKDYDPERGGEESSPLGRSFVFGLNLDF